MMAYLRALRVDCQKDGGCAIRASVELYTDKGQLMGVYCRRHGGMMLAIILGQELMPQPEEV